MTKRREAERKAESPPDYAACCGSGTRNPRRLIHALSRPPASRHDVADLTDPPAIGIRDARIRPATVTVSEETAARLLEQRTFGGIRTGHRAVELAGHLAVERRESIVAAHRQFAAGARGAAVKARPCT